MLYQVPVLMLPLPRKSHLRLPQGILLVLVFTVRYTVQKVTKLKTCQTVYLTTTILTAQKSPELFQLPVPTSISITGYRHPELSGNKTPVYSLTLNVAEAEKSEQTETTSSLWSDSKTIATGSGWYRSEWFGDFYGNSGGWTYHINHGWLYLNGSDEVNLWFYDEKLGWLFTGKELFPRIYRSSNSTWLYDQSDATTRKFWDYSTSENFLSSKN